MKRPLGCLLLGFASYHVEAYGVLPRPSRASGTTKLRPRSKRPYETRSDPESLPYLFSTTSPSPFTTTNVWESLLPKFRDDRTRTKAVSSNALRSSTRRTKQMTCSQTKSSRTAKRQSSFASSATKPSNNGSNHHSKEEHQSKQTLDSVLAERKREFLHKFQELLHMVVPEKTTTKHTTNSYGLFLIMISTHLLASILIPSDNSEVMSAAHWAATNAFLYTTLARSWRRD